LAGPLNGEGDEAFGGPPKGDGNGAALFPKGEGALETFANGDAFAWEETPPKGFETNALFLEPPDMVPNELPEIAPPLLFAVDPNGFVTKGALLPKGLRPRVLPCCAP
jgi:hypothetical protein